MLQHALLAVPEGLDAWLQGEVATRVDMELFCSDDIYPERYAEILRPVVESLPPRQRHVFRESLARDNMMQDTFDFLDSFDVKPTVKHIERVEE